MVIDGYRQVEKGTVEAWSRYIMNGVDEEALKVLHFMIGCELEGKSRMREAQGEAFDDPEYPPEKE